jgi:hypothetical protein
MQSTLSVRKEAQLAVARFLAVFAARNDTAYLLVPKLQFGNVVVPAITQPGGRGWAFQLCFLAQRNRVSNPSAFPNRSLGTRRGRGASYSDEGDARHVPKPDVMNGGEAALNGIVRGAANPPFRP